MVRLHKANLLWYGTQGTAQITLETVRNNWIVHIELWYVLDFSLFYSVQGWAWFSAKHIAVGTLFQG